MCDEGGAEGSLAEVRLSTDEKIIMIYLACPGRAHNQNSVFAHGDMMVVGWWGCLFLSLLGNKICVAQGCNLQYTCKI